MRGSVLATGLYFGEGPRWREGRLLLVSMECNCCVSTPTA